ncbi:MAG: NAD-dependent epimerase/dehydratase family protein [Balneolaceae bacterium]|nr:MAG: NAD-dependent epimerase/dehydratase family protein [Balneolaceae bacterium]
MGDRTALLAGATGLTGKNLLDILLANDSYSRVITAGRRKPDREHPKLSALEGQFNSLPDLLKGIQIDDIYCCLGTTLKKAGSRPAFYKVDFEYVLNLAEYGVDFGASQFLLISSAGANAQSSSFYIRVKGQVENAVKNLNYRGMHILRPSLLVGQRDEIRTGERVFERLLNLVSPLMIGPLEKYRPIEARIVAAAMVYIAAGDIPGVYFYESDEINAIGRNYQDRTS